MYIVHVCVCELYRTHTFMCFVYFIYFKYEFLFQFGELKQCTLHTQYLITHHIFIKMSHYLTAFLLQITKCDNTIYYYLIY